MLDRRQIICGALGLAVGAKAHASARPGRPTLEQIEEVYRGERRRHWVQIPVLTGRRAPLLVALTGNLGISQRMRRRRGWADTVQANGWVGLYPDTPPAPEPDLAYLSFLIERAWMRYPVDPTRTWVVGFGVGGERAYQLAARRSNLVSAIAVCSTWVGYRPDTHLWSPTQTRPRPVSILHLHGARDRRVLLQGPSPDGREAVGMVEGLARWVEHMGCAEAPARRMAGVPRVVRIRSWEASGGHRVVGLVDPTLAHRWPKSWANEAMAAFLRSTPPGVGG